MPKLLAASRLLYEVTAALLYNPTSNSLHASFMFWRPSICVRAQWTASKATKVLLGAPQSSGRNQRPTLKQTQKLRMDVHALEKILLNQILDVFSRNRSKHGEKKECQLTLCLSSQPIYRSFRNSTWDDYDGSRTSQTHPDAWEPEMRAASSWAAGCALVAWNFSNGRFFSVFASIVMLVTTNRNAGNYQS